MYVKVYDGRYVCSRSQIESFNIHMYMYNGITKLYTLTNNNDRKKCFIMFMIDVSGVLINFSLFVRCVLNFDHL